MLEVKEPGLFTTVQDLGRNGYQAYGMPVAGAMDEYACKMANRLLCNEPGAAVLEMTLLGGSFFFHQACWVAVTGAAMPISLMERRSPIGAGFSLLPAVSCLLVTRSRAAGRIWPYKAGLRCR